MRGSWWAISCNGAGGGERRGLRWIRKRGECCVGIGVAIADRVRQPAALSVDWNGRSGGGPTDGAPATHVFPAQSSAEQLVPARHVDLREELTLRELRRERGQTRLGIVDPASTGTIGTYRVQRRLRRRELVL